MRIHAAWTAQATSDVRAAHILDGAGAERCQIVATCQQAVEKAVKALVEAINSAFPWVQIGPTGRRHVVSGFVDTIMRSAAAMRKEHREWRGMLRRLFPDHIRVAIRELDAVVPEYPAKGALASRNTEYPFQVTLTDWRSPRDEEVFEKGQVKRFLHAAERVEGGVSKIISALELAFPETMT